MTHRLFIYLFLVFGEGIFVCLFLFGGGGEWDLSVVCIIYLLFFFGFHRIGNKGKRNRFRVSVSRNYIHNVN